MNNNNDNNSKYEEHNTLNKEESIMVGKAAGKAVGLGIKAFLAVKKATKEKQNTPTDK